MIAYSDSQLICRYASSAYGEWCGRSPETMIGAHIKDLLGERLFGMNDCYISGALKGEKQHFERTLIMVDAGIGYTYAHYIPDIDNGSMDRSLAFSSWLAMSRH